MKYIEVLIDIEPADEGRELLMAWLSELPFESFTDTPSGIAAYIRHEDFDRQAIDDLVADHFQDWKVAVRINEVAEQNWNEEWEKNFSPVRVGDRLLIRAPFHERDANVRREIIIHPRMSFGTGHHATTFLICEEMLDMNFHGKSVLDMGAGTGILAILAHQAGAGAVTAIDIDEWSVSNMHDNMALNGIEGVDVRSGDASVLLSLQRTFDIILANINRNVLLADMVHYTHCLNPGGHILFSGFFDTDAPAIIAEAGPEFKLVRQSVRDSWCMVHLSWI
ncbi:MAG: 50S ribosomal protein L11 methyltransferase [Flavobacteriales bacterium]|nr:50S ribosomal protein L11 methyltransferase [Flavobacteriales bacterium]